MYALTYRVPVSIVRCGNLFGGGDLNFNRTVPGVIQATLAGEPFLIRSDGKCIRDFLYVEDAVDAYLCLAEHAAKDESLNSEAFNFSLGIRMTVLELVEVVLRMMGRTDLVPVVRDFSKEEIQEQYLSPEKAHSKLGWVARYGMEEGLKRTIAWYREFYNNKQSTVAKAS